MLKSFLNLGENKIITNKKFLHLYLVKFKKIKL